MIIISLLMSQLKKKKSLIVKIVFVTCNFSSCHYVITELNKLITLICKLKGKKKQPFCPFVLAIYNRFGNLHF